MSGVDEKRPGIRCRGFKRYMQAVFFGTSKGVHGVC